MPADIAEQASGTMRKTTLLLMGLGVVLTGFSVLPLPQLLIWNRTPSVAKGLYTISDGGLSQRGDLVLFRPSNKERNWLETGGFIGRDWPLLKRISGLSGDTVCRINRDILINDELIAHALEADHLPKWSGCIVLSESEVFLLGSHPRSIDGRYFGPQQKDQIAGKAIPLWTYAN